MTGVCEADGWGVFGYFLQPRLRFGIVKNKADGSLSIGPYFGVIKEVDSALPHSGHVEDVRPARS